MSTAPPINDTEHDVFSLSYLGPLFPEILLPSTPETFTIYG